MRRLSYEIARQNRWSLAKSKIW